MLEYTIIDESGVVVGEFAVGTRILCPIEISQDDVCQNLTLIDSQARDEALVRSLGTMR